MTINRKNSVMLDLLLDLETMFGVPDGLLDKDTLIRRFGARAVTAACASGLVRHVIHPCRPAVPTDRSPMGLTSRGRMIAGCRSGDVFPIELAVEAPEIASTVLHGSG